MDKLEQYARMAYRLASEQLPEYSHRNSRHTYTQPQLISCVLIAYALGLSLRDIGTWLTKNPQIFELLELSEVPDYSSLYRAVQRNRRASVMKLYQQLRNHILADAAHEKNERIFERMRDIMKQSAMLQTPEN